MNRRRALSLVAKGAIAAGLIAAFGGGFGAGWELAPRTVGQVAPQGWEFGLELDHPNWFFVFVNHATTNPFFVPTQYGIQDAAKLLDVKYEWTGTETSDVGTMVNAIEQAIAANADGIATSVIAPNSFDAPIQEALSHGIPVYAYNAYLPTDDPKYAQYHNPPYLGYVGQDLYKAGQLIGQWILQHVPTGSRVALFIATPGTANIQPRIDGIVDVIQGHYTIDIIATGVLVSQEESAVESYFTSHPDVKGMFAVDAGSTESIALTMKNHGLTSCTNGGTICTGGFDLLPDTVSGIVNGEMDFTIDQQPYLQGFLPTLFLWLYEIARGFPIVFFADTGMKFVTKDNIAPYTIPNRYVGTSAAYLPVTGPLTATSTTSS
jgi:simple sugar transport system substrate-binding protein